jgi:hypothetical protein
VKLFSLYMLFLLLGCCPAQNVMEVITDKRKYDVYTNDVIEYKLKGEHHFKKDIVLNMNDSCLYLEKDSLVNVSKIKALRFHRDNHLLGTINGVCFIGGVGYVSLNFINNLILQHAAKVDPKAIYISASLVAAGIILKIIRVKHVHIKHDTVVRIVTRNYQNLAK